MVLYSIPFFLENQMRNSCVGEKYNRLTIIEELSCGNVRCNCECGGLKVARKSNLKAGLTTSCGCAKRKENLTDQTFSYLTVISYIKGFGYECLCYCGKTTIASTQSLKNGHKKSCGECDCKEEDFEKSMIGQTFKELTIISKSEQKETCKSKQRFWNCKCSCGKELVVSTSKLKTQLSCGHKSDNKVHNGLAAKNKYFYKKWHHFKQTNRLSPEFQEFKPFLDYVLENLGDREAEYAYLAPKDEKELVSPENITWKYLQHVKTFCDIEYKWCSNCERYVQNSDKFWTKKKGNFCRKCIKVSTLKRDHNLEYKDYLNLLNKCNRKCQICSGTDRLVVDHCHSSGKIRGILCSNCNSGLGQFRENIGHMKLAIDYLNKGTTDRVYKGSEKFSNEDTCFISNSTNLVVDHCHKTGLIRGNIDYNINLGIGLFQDDINLIEKAISYLGTV